MKLLTLAVTVVLACGLGTSAFANTVAVWNSQAAIANTNYAKAKITSTQASIKPKQQQLQSYKANIERLQQQYSTQKDKLSDAQKDDIRKQIQSNMQNYEQVASQIQSTVATNENDVLQKIAPKMQAITDNIIKAKNIDVLIDSRDGNISFVKPEWDLTGDFTQKINEQVR